MVDETRRMGGGGGGGDRGGMVGVVMVMKGDNVLIGRVSGWVAFMCMCESSNGERERERGEG